MAIFPARIGVSHVKDSITAFPISSYPQHIPLIFISHSIHYLMLYTIYTNSSSSQYLHYFCNLWFLRQHLVIQILHIILMKMCVDSCPGPYNSHYKVCFWNGILHLGTTSALLHAKILFYFKPTFTGIYLYITLISHKLKFICIWIGYTFIMII